MFVILIIHLLISYSSTLSIRSSFGNESYVDRSITIDLESKMTCLYEPLEKEMVLKLDLSPSIMSRFPMAMRLTSPSGEFSDWAEGNGEASFVHNTVEDGDYEICISTSKPIRVTLNLLFHNPNKLEQMIQQYLEVHNIDKNMQVSVRDEAMQQSSSNYIQTYVIIFCMAVLVVAIVEVILVRRMFHIDNKRIRI
ncbi:hypothetical protein DICVIV_13158 [Dictyocaulus viviparus]|uniref:GOLD domain-containing protein n=1 Tax=Dictyocaulus viviparus TaxID=29172 RepID=A0A0D8X8K6_DICVI|nr:hypothetical protein DICVIV_13158 [Dictyocaulus viviparus]